MKKHSSPGSRQREDEMLSSAVGGSSMDLQTQNLLANKKSNSEWKSGGQNLQEDQHFLN